MVVDRVGEVWTGRNRESDPDVRPLDIEVRPDNSLQDRMDYAFVLALFSTLHVIHVDDAVASGMCSDHEVVVLHGDKGAVCCRYDITVLLGQTGEPVSLDSPLQREAFVQGAEAGECETAPAQLLRLNQFGVHENGRRREEVVVGMDGSKSSEDLAVVALDCPAVVDPLEREVRAMLSAEAVHGNFSAKNRNGKRGSQGVDSRDGHPISFSLKKVVETLCFQRANVTTLQYLK